MSFLPQHSSLGRLNLLEVFEFYDGPKLFSCRNTIGNIFLVTWADEEDAHDTWLLVQLSQDRYERIRIGELSLQDAFLQAEEGIAYEAIDRRKGTEWEVHAVPVASLETELLPEGDQFLAKAPTAHEADERPDVSQRAKTLLRNVLDLRLGVAGFRVASRRLGQVLETLQMTIDAIGQAKTEEATEKGRIPSLVTQRTELLVAGAFPGSFGVELEAKEQEGVFPDSLVGESIAEFVELLEVSANPEGLRDRLFRLKKRTAIRYLYFLQSLTVDSLDISVDWGTPTVEKPRSVHLSSSVAKVAVAVIREIEKEFKDELITIEGILIAGDLARNTFKLKAGETIYSGDISESGVGTDLILDRPYTALLLKGVEISSMGEKVYFRLLSLDPFGESSTQGDMVPG